MNMPAGEMSSSADVSTPPKCEAVVATPREVASYVAQRIEGTEAVLAHMAAHEETCSSLAFQHTAWLRPLFEGLAVDLNAKALAVSVSDATTGELAVLLPLVMSREGRLSVVSWASLGVSDYGAPLLGPKSPANDDDARALWGAIRASLTGCDLVQLANMPMEIDGRINPLARVTARLPSRHARHALTLDGSVEAFLVSRGKKYRKEAERCSRLLGEKGTPEFKRAQSDQDISHAYATLQTQQRARHTARGSDYRLDEPAFARFFEEALRSGAPLGSAHIFTLTAGGETGAVLYGISHGTTFTLLRISTAGESWKRVSPGRLIVLDTMRYFLAHGINTFDMGIGDYDFKHGFGVEAQPLFDLVAPLSIKGIASATISRAKAQARRHPRLVDAAKRVLGHN